MARFLSNAQLYDLILEKSAQSKRNLLVCTTALGSGAHNILSEEIIKNPPADTRFIVRLSELAIQRGEVNPYEIQYLNEHLKDINIRTSDNFHSNIYIFDDSALLTSCSLRKEAFESNIEAGVLLEGAEAEQAKAFFNEYIWDSSKPIGELKKYKQMWNQTQKNLKIGPTKKAKTKPHTQIKDWTDAGVITWFIGVPKWISAKFERKIKKETSWPSNVSVIGDVGYNTFLQLKLGDSVYIADSSKRGKVGIEFASVVDKAHVETDEGDYHMAFERQKHFELKRDPFYLMLKNANIKSRSSETILNSEQINQISLALLSIKKKRKRKTAK